MSFTAPDIEIKGPQMEGGSRSGSNLSFERKANNDPLWCTLTEFVHVPSSHLFLGI